MESEILTSVVFLFLIYNGASHSVAIDYDTTAVRRPTLSGRKDFLLHDLGQPHRRRRAIISAEGPTMHDGHQNDRESRGPDMDTSELHVMNAFTSDLNVSVMLQNVTICNLRYGDVCIENLGRQLALTEVYELSVGNESYTDNVSSHVMEIPAQADVFLITDESYSGILRDTLTVWDRQMQLCNGCFWLLSYNAFSHSGLDVLVFDASKVGTDHYSLFRIGTEIESFDAYFVELQEGTYEVKVVAHNMIQDINDFKNTPSLTPPLFIHPKAGERYYAAIIGIYQDLGKFQPEYKSVPALPKTEPVPYHLTNVIVVNAFPNNSAVEIDFLDGHHFKPLQYCQTAVAQFNLKRWDVYSMRSGTQGVWHQTNVDVAVPYVQSECILIADMGDRGSLENTMHCGRLNDPQISLGHAHILTYHTVNNISVPIDVLLFDHSMLNNPNQHSLYSITYHLQFKHSVQAALPEGNYQVKVVPSDTIKDSTEFQETDSLLPLFSMRLMSGGQYYLILSGIFADQEYPAMHIVHTMHKGHELPTGQHSRQTRGMSRKRRPKKSVHVLLDGGSEQNSLMVK